jgi:hypothetical protein
MGSNNRTCCYEKRDSQTYIDRPVRSSLVALKCEEHPKIYLIETLREGVGWIQLTLDTVQWRDLLNAMTLRIP